MISPMDAQQRLDRIRAFEAERDALAEAHVLAFSPEQAAAVAAYHAGLRADLLQAHELDRDAAERRLSLGMRVASLIGALSLAASVYLLLERTLVGLPRAVTTAVLVALPIVTVGLVQRLLTLERSGYLARLVALVSCAAYAYDLVGLGTLYAIAPSDLPYLLCAVYATLLAFATRSTLLVATSVIAFDCFVAMRTGTVAGGYWLDFGVRPEHFLPAAALLLAVPECIDLRAIGFATPYRVWGLLTLFLPVLVLSNAGGLSYLPFSAHAIEVAYQTAGFVLSALAIGIGARRDQTAVVNTGVTFFVIFLYTKFYDWWWASLPKYLFFLIIGLTAVSAIVVLRAARARHGRTLGNTA
jgi:hypothetical protein